MSDLRLQATSLDYRTRSGFFLSNGGLRFWVMDSIPCRYAIQLDNSPSFQKFTSHMLHKIETVGGWLGPVGVAMGPEVKKSFRGRCGILGKCGLRYFLKVIDTDGVAQRRVILPGDLGQPHRFTSFFPHWQLKLSVGPSAVCAFQSDVEPPKILGRKAIVFRPRLVWSTDAPTESETPEI